MHRALDRLWNIFAIVRHLGLEWRLRPSKRRQPRPVVALGVHLYYPSIGGSELHTQCIAEELSARGYDVLVVTPRRWGQPLSVNGIPVGVHRFLLRRCDVLFTYSVGPETISLGDYAVRLRERVPLKWLHHPCAIGGPEGLEMLRACDGVVAMNPEDVALAVQARGGDEDVTRVVPASHPSKIGRKTDPSFRRRFGVEGDYILWVGAWLPAKGVRNLSRRFAAFRARRPDLPIKLVMFGGYGSERADAEFPDPHPDIVCVSHNTADLPAALRQCAFLAFNSPASPPGYDANPLVLIEAMMNGKTFVAQSGTPILTEISHLGIVVDTDEQWLEAVERLLSDGQLRASLETRCYAAYESTYNLTNMIDGFERAIAKGMGPGAA